MKLPASAAEEPPLSVFERRPGWRFFDLREMWRFRELLYFLVWRDLKVRYKQTALGVLWAVLQPTALMITFSLFFHGLAEVRSGAVPYPLFVFAGLVPWIFFANAVTSAGQSVVGNQALVTKVYFPRGLIPLSAVAVALVDFLISSLLLLVLMLCYGRPPGWGIVLVPFVMLALMLTALGVGALLAALTVAYRDFRYIVPFLIQLWMFATPTIYLRENVRLNPRWGLVLPLNPVDGLISNFRVALGLDPSRDWPYDLMVSVGVGAALFVLGCVYFRRVERSFADII